VANTAKGKLLLSEISNTLCVVSRTLETPLTCVTIPCTHTAMVAAAKPWHGQQFLVPHPHGPSISQGGGGVQCLLCIES